MTIVTSSFTLTPYNGGTVVNSPASISWCQLSPTRMVAMFYQTAPNGRRFVIIDNPDGLNSTTPPSVNPITYWEANYQTGMVRLERLNSNTFLVMTPASNSNALNPSYNMEVFSITGTTVTKEATSTWTQPGWNANRRYVTPWYQSWYLHAQCFTAANTADNCIMLGHGDVFPFENSSYRGNFDYAQAFGLSKAIWNPTTKVLTVTRYYQAAIARAWGGGYDPYVSWTSTVVEYQPMSWYVNQSVGGITFGVRMRTVGNPTSRRSSLATNGSVWAPVSNNTVTAIRNGNQFYEYGMMSNNRVVFSDYNSAYYFDPNMANNQGGASFPVDAAGDMSIAMPFVLGLDANHHAVIDSRHFAAPTTSPFRMKVIRREDSNMVFPSPASNTDYGFTVNVPAVRVANDKPNPVVISSGDIMWAGLEQNSSKFQYVILKQPPLPN